MPVRSTGHQTTLHIATGSSTVWLAWSITELQRSVNNIANDTIDTQSAIWDEVREGLDECTQ
jgi:hypothetical protein